MGNKILIVEDQFIEANDLRLTLEEAGHTVCGIAKSYDHAIILLERDRPEIVLVDIFLKGKLTGLDLAVILSKENIPFIYLSANSSASILETAKATRPYGFLVKPFREKDVLVALDIASYRHSHSANLIQKQEMLLSGILSGIIQISGNAREKLLKVVQAFKHYIPFNYLHIDLNVENEDLRSVFCFRRIGYDDYEFNDGWQIMKMFNLNHDQYVAWRRASAANNVIKIENSSEFQDSCAKNPFVNSLRLKYGVNSRLVAPLLHANKVHMSLRFYSVEPDAFNADHLELINPLRSLLSMILEDIRQVQDAACVTQIDQNRASERSAQDPVVEGIVGNSPKLLHALDQVMQVANFDMSVLVLGETGVGKEGLVKAIHHLSGRSKKPLIKINCGAIPATLIESELFGHERGAFTGALERRIGKFEQAHGGTIFLDEVGEMPLEVQTKLLRVLQEKELERIGGRATIKVDVRVVAATNRNLDKDVADGRFRMDLYYRINVFPITLAPLRERKEDIPLLIDYFLKDHAAKTKSVAKQIDPGVMIQLINYSWPGNIRELQHIIERNSVLSSDNIIKNIALPGETQPEHTEEFSYENFQSIAEVDRAHIIAALKRCKGRVSGKGGAAEILNLPATTLNSKMKKLGISWKFLY